MERSDFALGNTGENWPEYQAIRHEMSWIENVNLNTNIYFKKSIKEFNSIHKKLV